MKNKFLSVIIALSLILSCAATSSFAASTFPDVLSPDHDWAAEQIEEMSKESHCCDCPIEENVKNEVENTQENVNEAPVASNEIPFN